jgi:hypothetical protein
MRVISDFAERETILESCEDILSGMSEDDIIGLYCCIQVAFHQWLLRQADERGMVRVARIDRTASGESVTITNEPVKSVRPHECVEPFGSNEIGLALKLFSEMDPNFMSVIKRHGVAKTFAVVGLWCEDVETFHLSRLSGVLTRDTHATSQALIDQKKSAMASGRKAGVKSRADDAAEAKRRYRKAATILIREQLQKGQMSLKAVVVDLQNWESRKDEALRLPERSESTIREYIDGIMEATKVAYEKEQLEQQATKTNG